MRDVGLWRDMASSRITITHKRLTDEVDAARARGDVICTSLSGDELEKEFPRKFKGTPYAAFADAREDIRVCFVTAGNPVADYVDVINEAALGMMDNSFCVWR